MLDEKTPDLTMRYGPLEGILTPRLGEISGGFLQRILTPRLGEFSGEFLAGEFKIFTTQSH